MPDRPRNRPRIAGHSRPSTQPKPDDLTTKAGEAPAEPVTPVTGPASPDHEEAAQRAVPVTPGSHPGSTVGLAPAVRGGGAARVLTVTLGVLIVLVLTLAGVLGVKAWRGKQAEDARGQAAAAGRRAAETALSYDYRKLDQSFADARATMTPEFAATFDETAKVAGELATKTKATVRADVREVGIRDGDADRVTLIIFVNQTTTSTITQGKPRVDLNRTRFTMVRSGDRWLVQEIAGL